MQQDITVPGAKVAKTRMTKDEADLAWRTIHNEMGKANEAESRMSKALLRIHEGEGWRHLGFRSFEACLKDVQAEYGVSRSTLFRQLKIAQAEHYLREAGVISDDEHITHEVADMVTSSPGLAIEAAREVKEESGKVTAVELAKKAPKIKKPRKPKKAKEEVVPTVETVSVGAEVTLYETLDCGEKVEGAVQAVLCALESVMDSVFYDESDIPPVQVESGDWDALRVAWKHYREVSHVSK